MARIVEFDLLDALAPSVPPWITGPAIGVLAAALTALTRLAIDLVAPGGAPFALVYPAIMLATLVGRWQAGAITGLLTIGAAWRFVLPNQNAFTFASGGEANALVAVVIAAIITIAIAETFRRAVRNAAAERDRQIADRDLFLAEFDHRVKNNFAIVASLLELQRKRADPATAEALTAALTRVDSIARAHQHLYRGGDQPGTVEIADYLSELCSALRDALMLAPRIDLTCHSETVALPRDLAVSIGLVVNELVTNATKHAFVGRDEGAIEVRFTTEGSRLRLTVRDDGVGMSTVPQRRKGEGGLGTRLIASFARQAGGTVSIASDGTGSTVTVDMIA